jgi:pyruvate formate lyase activating enzyme
MTEPENTPAATLISAAEIGRRAGLRYVYAGNLPGDVGKLENSYCFTCGERLIWRYGYRIREYKITPEGRRPSCFCSVPGRWAHSFQRQITDHPLLPVMAG